MVPATSKKIMATAELASSLKPDAMPQLKKAFADEDSAVRYWAVQGVLMRGQKGVASAHDELVAALGDSSGSVRVVAAEALARYGSRADLDKALPVLARAASNDEGEGYVALMAVNTIDKLDAKAAPLLGDVKKLTQRGKQRGGRARGYVARVVEKILADAKGR